MIISEITLHNYKSFEGTHKICCLSEDIGADKPIVLFGGLNGAGKTSIFESLLLCFYGSYNTALWPSRGAKREVYSSYIESVVNIEAKTRNPLTRMYIEVVLDQVEFGDTFHSLKLKRVWECSSEGAREVEFAITQDGHSIEYITKDNYTDFIKEELIPIEVSEFFFFDGEKIQDFVRDEDQAFTDSLEAVLGISLYRTLKDDLNKVRKNIQDSIAKDKDVEVKLSDVKREIESKEYFIRESQEAIEQLQEDRDDLENKRDRIDRETHRITSVHPESKEQLETKRDRLNQEKGEIEGEIATIQNELPFVIMDELMQQLINQLDLEQEQKSALAAKNKIVEEADEIARDLFRGDEPIPPLTENQKAFYLNRLREIFLQKSEARLDLQSDILHDLSSSDAAKIKQQVSSAREVIRPLTSKIQRLEVIDIELTKMDRTAQRATTDETRRLFIERGQLDEQIKTKDAEIESLKVRIQQATEDIRSLQRRQTELNDKVALQSKKRGQIEYCKKLKEAIEVFSERLRLQKLSQLEKYTLEMWTRLARKQDQVAKLSVRSEGGFHINLLDKLDRPIDKTKLSAGEKEILAISLIYALRKLTSRNLPIVIDTPLGRLDSKHRARIAAAYFPKASHQVILLSTDTEIVREEYEAVKPHIAKQYLIKKDSAAQSSYVEEDTYFATETK